LSTGCPQGYPQGPEKAPATTRQVQYGPLFLACWVGTGAKSVAWAAVGTSENVNYDNPPRLLGRLPALPLRW